MSIGHAKSEQRLVLYGVPWRTYERALRTFSDRPGVRLTYDRGALEIMALSHEHENRSFLLGRLVVALTEELGLPLKGGGSTTFRRRRRQRGIEPNNCYWIANESLVRSKDKIDLRNDPPPDLALEIDVTHSSIDRLSIYVALCIPEVWRQEGQVLDFHILGVNGKYSVSPTSRAFPKLTSADLLPFLALRGQIDENAIVRQFRTWVHQHLIPRGATPPTP
jgi:Uma2 family endonuclease